MYALVMAGLRRRRSLDYRSSLAMSGPVIEVRAFESIATYKKRTEITPERGENGYATVFEAVLRFPVLIGPGKTKSDMRIVVNTAVDGYPDKAPTVQAQSAPLPWNQHFSSNGLFCVGDRWEKARGHELVAHMIIHVAHTLNLDIPSKEEHFGYNQEAFEYWQDVLNFQPLNKNINYPTVPDLAFGAEDELPNHVSVVNRSTPARIHVGTIVAPTPRIRIGVRRP